MYLSAEEHEFTQIYCAHCGEKHVIVKPCGYRFCPVCGHIRRWRIRERLSQVFKLMKHRRGYMLKMLTLSSKNSTDLKRGIDELLSGFRRLRQSKLWDSHIAGGLFVLEIKGTEGDWHPHLHCFIYSLRIEWRSLRDQWFKASKGGSAVWIRNVSNNEAIYYVTKYVTKSDVDPGDMIIADKAMKGRRTFQRFGSFQKIKLPKYYTAAKCKNCGNCDWLTEWDFHRLGLQLPCP